jgi:hypothetical protein
MDRISGTDPAGGAAFFESPILAQIRGFEAWDDDARVDEPFGTNPIMKHKSS